VIEPERLGPEQGRDEPMNRSSLIKLFTATAAALALAATPALAQDPLSQGYAGESDLSNEVLGDTGEGGDTPISDPGDDPGSDPSDIAGDAGSGSDDPVEAAASATASDPADPAAAEPAAARPVDSLPFTGADVTLLGAMGVGLFLLGLGLSLLTHRRSRLSL